MSTTINDKVKKIISLCIIAVVSLTLIIVGSISLGGGTKVKMRKTYEISSYKQYTVPVSRSGSYKIYVEDGTIGVVNKTRESDYVVSKESLSSTRYNGYTYDACYEVYLRKGGKYTLKVLPDSSSCLFVVVGQ